VGRPIAHSFPETIATATPGGRRELHVGTDPPRDLEVTAVERAHRGGRIIVGEDVTVRARQRRQLEAQNTQLERLATIIAHDLRTPLSTAQKALELLQLEQPETRARATEDLEALLAYFTAITEDLPQLARASTELAEREPCSLSATARDAWAALDPPAEVTLRTPADVTVYADRVRLRRLVGNLLENAIQHGGAVTTVTVAPTDRGFHVADDGDGLGAADPAELFEYGVSAGGSSGVGLSVVDSIAAAHGWRLEVGATDGGGTTVRVDMATAGETIHG
jgi:signal transduction histidine kinase